MKKKTKKALALALCAVMLVAGTALTTIAYLTSKDSVTNTFTVGKVNITLDEKIVDEYGNPTQDKDGNTRTSEGNEYKLVPAVTYEKDPTVTVLADSEQCYVRMILTVNNIANLKTGIKNNTVTVDNYEVFLLENLCKNKDNNSTWNKAWEMFKYTEEEGKGIYEFRYNTVVDTRDKEAEVLPALFTHFTVPSTVTETDITSLNGVILTVEAHAIQEAGFENNADAAWAAFDAQYNPPVQP